MTGSASKLSRLRLALLWTGLVATDCAAQLLFKSAAVRLPEPRAELEWLAMVAQSPRVWAAVACLSLTFGLWMLILRRAPISTAFPATALTIVGVAAGSWWLFDESITLLRYAGIALIVTGVVLLRPLERAPENPPSRTN